MDIVIGASVRFLKPIVLSDCTGLKFADKGEEAEIEQLPRRTPNDRSRRGSGYGARDFESWSFKRCMDGGSWRYTTTTEPRWSGGDD